MIKKISCRVIGSFTPDKSGGGQCSGRFNNRHFRAGGIIYGYGMSGSSDGCVGSVKGHRLAVGLLSYTRQSDIKVAFGGTSTGRTLDYYA